MNIVNNPFAESARRCQTRGEHAVNSYVQSVVGVAHNLGLSSRAEPYLFAFEANRGCICWPLNALRSSSSSSSSSSDIRSVKLNPFPPLI